MDGFLLTCMFMVTFFYPLPYFVFPSQEYLIREDRLFTYTEAEGVGETGWAKLTQGYSHYKF